MLYFSHSDLTSAVDVVQDYLNCVVSWCNRNKLALNVKKTQYMVVASSQKLKKASRVRIHINKLEREKVISYKYLGFIIDHTLNFNKHINNITSKVNHTLYILNRIRPYLIII